MRGIKGRAVCGVALLGVLSLDCGGTFCDEYPEACGALAGGASSGGSPGSGAGGSGGSGGAGGEGSGAGGGGGAPPGPIDVLVSLVDQKGDAPPLVPLLVTDADGAVLQSTDTSPDGSATVTVPEHGRVWLFLELGGVHRVYSAEVVAGMSEIRFLVLPEPAPPNSPETVDISFYCVDCGSSNEVSLSCKTPTPLVDSGPYYDATINGYTGCPGTNTVEATVVSYDASGNAFKFTQDDAPLTGLFALPENTPVAANERFDLDMAVTGAFDLDIDWSVEVPSAYGYDFSRRAETTTGSSKTFSLVTQLVPTFVARTVVKFGPTRLLTRIEELSGVSVDTQLSIDIEELALPAAAPPVDFTDPAQPEVSFSLGEGPLGDVVFMTIYDPGGSRWMLALPSSASATIRLPELPADLEAFALTTGTVSVGHLDLDDVDGYVELTQSPLLSPLEAVDLVNVTLAYAL